MKIVFELLIVTIIFMGIGSLFAIPNILIGVYTYSDIFGYLLLGSFVFDLFWLFIFSAED